jgi:GAF domain-containing protein
MLLTVLLCGTGLVVALTVVSPGLVSASPLGSSVPVVGMVVLSLTFVAYVVEKERNVAQLALLVRSEQEASERLGLHLRKLEAVLAASATLSRAADPVVVERLILEQAVELLQGASGAVYARLGTDFSLVATMPPDVEPSALLSVAALGADEAGSAAARSVPSENGPSSVVGVALRYEGVSVALLAVEAPSGQDFDEIGLALLNAFADQASTVLMNARRYADRREAVAASTGLASVRAEFDWLSGES